MKRFHLFIWFTIIALATMAQPNPYIFFQDDAIYLNDAQTKTTQFISDEVDDLRFLAVDETGLYYTVHGGTRLEKCDLDGGNRQTLWQGTNSGIAGSRFVLSTSYDFPNSKAYFTTAGTSLSALAGNFLLSVDLNTGKLDTLIQQSQDKLLMAVGVDVLNEHLYFASIPEGIYRTDLNGDNKTQIIDDSNFTEAPSQIAIDSDNQTIYWVEAIRVTNAVRKVKFDGSGFETVIPNNIEADLGVYFDFENDRIFCNPFSTILSTDLNGQNPSFTETGFTNTVSVDNPAFFFTMDDAYFYQYRKSEIIRTNRSDKTQQIIFKGFYPDRIQVDHVAGRLYYTLPETTFSTNSDYRNKVLSVDLDGGDLAIHNTQDFDDLFDPFIVFDQRIIYEVTDDNDSSYILQNDTRTDLIDTLAIHKEMEEYLTERPYISDYLNTRSDFEAEISYYFILNTLYKHPFDGEREPLILFGLENPHSLEFNLVDKRLYYINEGDNAGFFSAKTDGSDIIKISSDEYDSYRFLYPDTPQIDDPQPPLKEVEEDDDPEITLDVLGLQQKVKLYPNPANDFLILESDMTGQKSIVITDLTGRIVMTKSYSSQDIHLDISTLKRGLYQIQIHNNNQTYVERFIKR